jgi:hypothetical protein
MGLVSQIVTLIAVLGAAAGSYFVGRMSDKDKFSRELQVRWDQRRLDAYIVFMAAAKMTGTYANRIHEQQQVTATPEAYSGRYLKDLNRSEFRRSEAFESLVLLAESATIEAAHSLNRAVWKLENPARRSIRLGEDEWLRLADDWIAAMNDFHAAARADLKVTGSFARRDTAALAVSRPERGKATEGGTVT